MGKQQRFEQFIATFSTDAQAILRAVFLEREFCGVMPAAEVQLLIQTVDLSIEQLMVKLLDFAKHYAMPPISQFRVGAISQGLSGSLYFGANMEFGAQALNATVHAEQASVINAWVHGEQGISIIAINGVPCGHCRQFLNELCTAPQLRLVIPDEVPILLSELLPNAFGPQDLANDSGLMHPVDHLLTLKDSVNDPTTSAALAMANRSYAPYSGNYAGVAIQTEAGQLYAAPYAENAAFNPSLSPLQGLLIIMNLSGVPFKAIQKAVLVEMEDTLCSQVHVTTTLLSSLLPIELVIKFAKGTE